MIWIRLLRYAVDDHQHRVSTGSYFHILATSTNLVSFILYSLYASTLVTINAFESALFVVYTKEREKAVNIANEGRASANEQFVWVVWKILKGDGNDVSLFLF